MRWRAPDPGRSMFPSNAERASLVKKELTPNRLFPGFTSPKSSHYFPGTEFNEPDLAASKILPVSIKQLQDASQPIHARTESTD